MKLFFGVALLALILGFLPVLPVFLAGSPYLNNDLLPAYFCYFWDFHRDFSFGAPLSFWSSSYQTGMPMHAYWQSGYLYPLTWALFGPFSPLDTFTFFLSLHFSLAFMGTFYLSRFFRIKLPGSLWAALAFSLSGTLLARYEHPTMLVGFSYLPLVLLLFFRLAERPSRSAIAAFAAVIALQALGGHPQASFYSAFAVSVLLLGRLVRDFAPRGRPPQGLGPGAASRPSLRRRYLACGLAFLLSLTLSAPLLLPFFQFLPETLRYDGQAFEGEESPLHPQTPSSPQSARSLGDASSRDFTFREFTAGALKPWHLVTLVLPQGLGFPHDGTWSARTSFSDIFQYLGFLPLFFLFFVPWRRLDANCKTLLLLVLLALWVALGPLLQAGQLLFQIPMVQDLRRPGRILILLSLGLAVFSGNGLDRYLARFAKERRDEGKNPAGSSRPGRAFLLRLPPWGFFLGGILLFLFLHLLSSRAGFLHFVQSVAESFLSLHPDKDYARKIRLLSGNVAEDALFIALSGLALLALPALAARLSATPHFRPRPRPAALAAGLCRRLPLPFRPGAFPLLARGLGRVRATAFAAFLLLFPVLLLDLLRLHHRYFYRFPASFYREPPRSLSLLDPETSHFYRIRHDLEYGKDGAWNLHHDPLNHLSLFEREKEALSFGIHAVFHRDHAEAFLPLLWKEGRETPPERKSLRYLLTNARAPAGYRLIGPLGDGPEAAETGFHGVRVFENSAWRPRFERKTRDSSAAPALSKSPTASPINRMAPALSSSQEHGGLQVRRHHAGRYTVRPAKGLFQPGDTLFFREHFHAEWRYRLLRPMPEHGPEPEPAPGPGIRAATLPKALPGLWEKPRRAETAFMALVIEAPAPGLEIRFIPFSFYSGVALALFSLPLLLLFPGTREGKASASAARGRRLPALFILPPAQGAAKASWSLSDEEKKPDRDGDHA